MTNNLKDIRPIEAFLKCKDNYLQTISNLPYCTPHTNTHNREFNTKYGKYQKNLLVANKVDKKYIKSNSDILDFIEIVARKLKS